jgi:uncharacterized protein YraI
LRRLLTTFGFGLLCAGPALAGPAMTTTDTLMRESPSSHARIVQSIPANAQIDVEGCGPVWCSASWRNMPGYLRARSVVAGGGPPLVDADGPPPTVVGPPVVVAPFGYGYYGWGHPWRHDY